MSGDDPETPDEQVCDVSVAMVLELHAQLRARAAARAADDQAEKDAARITANVATPDEVRAHRS